MKLYYSPGACSLSPHIVLEEAGLPYRAVRVDLSRQPHLTEDGVDFATINSKGYVPALALESGAVITEGAAIVQYIGDLVPEKKLAPPAGTFERVHLHEWLHFIGTEIHRGFSPLWDAGAPPETKTQARARLEKRFGWLEHQLAGREYLIGSYFGAADAYLFTCLNWCAMLDLPLDKYPALQAYLARVAERPAVRIVLEAEGLRH